MIPHGEILIWAVFNLDIYFFLLSPCLIISFYQLQLDRYRHPSTSESQGLSTSPDTSNQERGRPKLKTKTLDGSALEDVDTGIQRDEASSSRHHGDKAGWLEGSFMVIIFMTHVKKLKHVYPSSQ